MEGYHKGEGWGRMGEKVQVIRNIKWQVENRKGEVQNSMGNEEAKELICMTHGHELRWENDGGKGCTGQRGIQRRKKWDNCNVMINIIYF